MFLQGGARQHTEFRHRSDGGQRFAPEAHGGHRLQVVKAADLAGRMPFERQRHLGWRHAATVVFHTDEPHAAFGQSHHHLCGTCV